MSTATGIASIGHSRLEGLCPELVLSVMRFLPTLQDLNSLTCTNKYFYRVSEAYQYGVCGAVAGNQFGDMWDDAKNLLQHGQRMGRLCHVERSSPSSTPLGGSPRQSSPSPSTFPVSPSSTNDDKVPPPSHKKEKECCKKPGIGIFGGGKEIGLAEATMLMKYSRRSVSWKHLVVEALFSEHPWDHVKHGIKVTDVPVSNICSITTQQSVRIDRALLRYYLLLLVCTPDWVNERTNYHLLFLHHNLFSDPIESEEESEMSHDERIDRKRSRVEPFLRFRGRDLSDIYVVARGTTGCWSQLPGTVEQGADHPYERWSNVDDSCVQQEADIHIKRIWGATENRGSLTEPDIFFRE